MPIETLRPNADGDLAQLYLYPYDGIHWNKVSDVVPDGDATYVHRYGGTPVDVVGAPTAAVMENDGGLMDEAGGLECDISLLTKSSPSTTGPFGNMGARQS